MLKRPSQMSEYSRESKKTLLSVTSKTQVSSPPLSDLEQRIKLISSKLDEGNVKG